MSVLIDDMIRSKDHAHTHVARQILETKNRSAIRQPGNWQTVFAQMRSQIAVPQLGNIAANRGNEDACTVHFGPESPALRETFVKNRSLQRAVRPRRRRVPARNGQVDKPSGHRCRTDLHDTSAVDHFRSCSTPATIFAAECSTGAA
jgi:hypothetical protein